MITATKTETAPNDAAAEAVRAEEDKWLTEIAKVSAVLTRRFAGKLEKNYDLDRTLVSFQANKSEGGHRWCKYKEGFSAALIRYVIEKAGISAGPILDPFAGSGTTLFVASEHDLDAVGIELLPSSAEIIEVRHLLTHCDVPQMAKGIRRFAAKRGWEQDGEVEKFQHLRITDGAFPVETAKQLGRYLADTYKVKDTDLRRVLRFAAFCVLEKISYTRKDGQYLRWDHRSGRCLGKKVFDKGRIWEFTEAVTGKLAEIAQDISGGGELFACPAGKGKITLKVGSCLDIMPTLDAHSFAGLITSPPYCNRYDYTRTYALELAMFGTGEDALKALRQEMLSCTVENREKESLPQKSNTHLFEKAKTAFESQELLTLILKYLDWCRESGTINNNGIPRMVLNYFRELTLVIFECARVLKRGAPMIMVNDNVRYQGAIIPVDLILSDIAQSAGFDVEAIWVLPVGKGNSSQQMGKHGREEIRKCVYVWRAK